MRTIILATTLAMCFANLADLSICPEQAYLCSDYIMNACAMPICEGRPPVINDTTWGQWRGKASTRHFEYDLIKSCTRHVLRLLHPDFKCDKVAELDYICINNCKDLVTLSMRKHLNTHRESERDPEADNSYEEFWEEWQDQRRLDMQLYGCMALAGSIVLIYLYLKSISVRRLAHVIVVCVSFTTFAEVCFPIFVYYTGGIYALIMHLLFSYNGADAAGLDYLAGRSLYTILYIMRFIYRHPYQVMRLVIASYGCWQWFIWFHPTTHVVTSRRAKYVCAVSKEAVELAKVALSVIDGNDDALELPAITHDGPQFRLRRRRNRVHLGATWALKLKLKFVGLSYNKPNLSILRNELSRIAKDHGDLRDADRVSAIAFAVVIYFMPSRDELLAQQMMQSAIVNERIDEYDGGYGSIEVSWCFSDPRTWSIDAVKDSLGLRHGSMRQRVLPAL